MPGKSMAESVEDFEKNIRRCRDCLVPGMESVSGLLVAVITVCGSLSTRINIQRLVELDPSDTDGAGECEMTYSPSSRAEKTFYNCLNMKFKFTDSSGVTSNIIAKIFPNGSISVPGCRTIQAVHEAPEWILNRVRRLAGLSGGTGGPGGPGECVADLGALKLSNLRIVMINSNFALGRTINQEQLKDLVNSVGGLSQWRTANFQPEKYSGVNIRYFTRAGLETARTFVKSGMKVPFKMSGQLSIFVFRSGKCTITGAKSTSDILEAYVAITRFVFENPGLSLNKPCSQ